MSDGKFTFIIGNYSHNTLYQGRFSFTILSYECYLLPPIDGEVDIVKNNMRTVCFPDILTDHGIITTTAGTDKFETEGGIIFFIYLNALYFLQLLDTALYLYGFSCFIAETFDKILSVLYLFLLILIGTALLLTAFFTQYDKLVVFYSVIVDLSAGDLNGTGSDIIEESPVVADQHYGIGTCRQEVFQPLDTLDIKVVGWLIQ